MALTHGDRIARAGARTGGWGHRSGGPSGTMSPSRWLVVTTPPPSTVAVTRPVQSRGGWRVTATPPGRLTWRAPGVVRRARSPRQVRGAGNATSPRPEASHAQRKGVHGRRGATGGFAHTYDPRRGRRDERTSQDLRAGRVTDRGRGRPGSRARGRGTTACRG